jgi:hypothetical protein
MEEYKDITNEEIGKTNNYDIIDNKQNREESKYNKTNLS